MSAPRRQKGFNLLDVLIAMIVIAVGLLGLAALQSKAQQAELEAFQRAQALILLQDMVSRIDTNRRAGRCYAVSSDPGGDYNGDVLGTGNSTVYDCGGAFGTTDTSNLANTDLAEWDALLRGTSETLGSQSVGAMVGGRGCVLFDPVSEEFTISVAWQGLLDTTAPANPCGTGLYGDETKRRAVSTTFRIGDLN